MNRINWIDWAKCMAITTVVFCHLPQSQEWMYYRYLQACIITIFFFLSGYLKRDRGSMGENWRKYWWGLILPYIIYNALMLPYWVARYYLQQGGWPDMEALMKPIVGALLLQHSSNYAEPLNGTLWYLPALLLMHLITDLCHRTRYEHWLLSGLCLLSVAGYFLYKYHAPNYNLTTMGFLRRLPYFYLGYVFGRQGLLRNKLNIWQNALLCAGFLSMSILLFQWHMYAWSEPKLHIVLFYPLNFCFVMTVVYGSKLLDGWSPQWMINLSIGTLVIVGLQWMFIGIVNYSIAKTFGLGMPMCYQWYEALPLTLLITAIHYPIILIAKKYAPILLGRKL